MTNRPDPKFFPGELVEVAKSYTMPHLQGQRFTIKERRWVFRFENTSKGGWGYTLNAEGIPEKTEDGKRMSFAEYQLRHPPKDEPTTFENCVWQPSQQKETA